MSWSNSWTGRRRGIVAAMGRYSETLTGSSKAEFEQARPHIEALVGMNRQDGGDPIVAVEASGSAWEGSSTATVSIRRVGQLSEEPE